MASKDNYHRMVADPMRTAWRQIHDARGKREEMLAKRAEKELARRRPLMIAAVVEAQKLRYLGNLERDMSRGVGVKWDALMPLKAHERTEIFRQLRKAWGLPPEKERSKL